MQVLLCSKYDVNDRTTTHKVSAIIQDGHASCPKYWSYHAHPWTIHRWTPCLLPSVRISVVAAVTMPIHGLSMDGHLAYFPLSEYL